VRTLGHALRDDHPHVGPASRSGICVAEITEVDGVWCDAGACTGNERDLPRAIDQSARIDHRIATMTLDVRGSLKNTKLSKNPYVVFDELFANSIDAFLIRKEADPSAETLEIVFSVTLQSTDMFDKEFNLEISCKDNGVGFDDDQVKAFITKDTSYKDDLPISGIGQCKGCGRIQYFHHFSRLRLHSNYRKQSSYYSRALDYDEHNKEIGLTDFRTTKTTETAVGTMVALSHPKVGVLNRVLAGEPLASFVSAKNLKTHILVTFMQRLIGLKSRLGKFTINFHVTTKTAEGKEVTEDETLAVDDLPTLTDAKSVNVHERDPKTWVKIEAYQILKISHYKMSAKEYHLPSNAIALCAKASPVKDITDRYLRPKAVQTKPREGYYHVVLVEGELLDTKVNEQRDDFDIPEDLKPDLITQDRISLEDIFDAIDDVIIAFVPPPNWRKEEIVRILRDKFGISDGMLSDTDTRIRYGESSRSVAKRVLGKYQDRVVDETDKLLDLKEEIRDLEPDAPAFREKVNELAWKYTATLKNIDMANLSQLIVRRSAIIEVLDLACNKLLNGQGENVEGKRKDETLIHSVFFPMRKDSHQVRDHDIWLLSEEYQYFDYIASDVPLGKIRWTEGDTLFESDIDEVLAQRMKENADDNAGKRPDIAIFGEEGAAIIIEFKTPGVDVADHIQDLMEYAQLLAAKSKGRLSKFYGYLIGDLINPNRVIGYKRFPKGKGWFGTFEIREPATDRRLGELYSELLYYEDIVKRAEKRLAVYKERLNLEGAD
jgi:hypothetical protein